MKSKLSISVEDSHVFAIEKLVKTGRFRNKSHVLEYALKRYLEGSDE